MTTYSPGHYTVSARVMAATACCSCSAALYEGGASYGGGGAASSPLSPLLVTRANTEGGLMWPEMVDTADSVPEKKPEELRITEATRSGGTSWGAS